MLNELHLLSVALNKASITPKDWHQDLQGLPKISAMAPCFRIMFSSDLSVRSINEISAELAGILQKWGNKQGSFPAFNLPALYHNFSDEETKKMTAWIKGAPFVFSELKSWCTPEKDYWKQKHIQKLKRCIHKKPQELLQKIDDKTEKNSIIELVRILNELNVVEESASNKKNLRTVLEQHIFEQLEKGENIQTLLKFLMSTKKPDDISSSVILDIYEWQTFSYPVANEKSMKWLNETLLKADKIDKKTVFTETVGNDELLDAFGDTDIVVGKKMPPVKLPHLGEVILRSMFSAHRCQLRYGLLEDKSYPIGKSNRDNAKKSLEWLSDSRQNGETWGIADDKELLFAYPTTIPPINSRWAKFLGGVDTTERFKDIAEKVIQTLEGLPPDKKPKDVQIFAIRKMDKARSKVVFYRNYTTERLIQAAKEWQIGCENIPPVTFRAWTKKINQTDGIKNEDREKPKPEKVEPETPKPLQVARIVNRIWKMDGKLAAEPAKTPKKMKHCQGLELMLDRQITTLDSYLLRTLIDNSHGLVLYLGDILHRNNVLSSSFRELRENYIYLLPILGLFLYRRNYLKETYMESLPYLLGQMLKVSDELHALYCQVVRDDIPPQLVGNSFLSAMPDKPIRTFADLMTRMKPYFNWGQRFFRNKKTIKGDVSSKEKWRLAGHFLKQYREIADQLKNADLPESPFDDLERAKLYIGYLASFPKKKNVTNGTPKTEK